jgi:hypothetical protein
VCPGLGVESVYGKTNNLPCILDLPCSMPVDKFITNAQVLRDHLPSAPLVGSLEASSSTEIKRGTVDCKMSLTVSLTTTDLASEKGITRANMNLKSIIDLYRCIEQYDARVTWAARGNVNFSTSHFVNSWLH